MYIGQFYRDFKKGICMLKKMDLKQHEKSTNIVLSIRIRIINMN